MQNSFTVFYSWQMSTSKEENRSFIETSIKKASEKIKTKLNVDLLIDKDSRNTTRKDSIDYTILQKIPNCDFFIGDITPVAKDNNGKPVPNPNVMLELGFAAKAIGWARCIFVWNTKYGDINQAPFDIRNRSIVQYNSDTDKDIDLYSILHDKIERYEKILSEQKNDEIDYNVFQYWNNRISPQMLNTIVEEITTNCGFYKEKLDILDEFQADFTTNIANHFRNSSLENSRKELNESLKNFCFYLVSEKFNRSNENYWTINDKYTKYDSTVELKIIEDVRRLGNDVMDKNKNYYESLQSAFGYLG